MSTKVERAVGEAHEQLVAVGAQFELGEHALTAPGPPPTMAQCGDGLMRLSKVASRIKFWGGDLLALTETLFAEEAAQIIDSELMDEREVKAEIFVATHVAPRVRDLAPAHDPWGYCNAVAGLKPSEQEEFLLRAGENDWSLSKLRAEVAAAKAGGESKMRFLLIVDVRTEALQEKVGAELEGRGYHVTKRTGLRKEAKPKKAAKAKKGPVTAQRKHKGAPKMYTRRRAPK